MKGKPYKYNEDVVQRITQALRAGNTRRASCAYAGISEDTFAVWLKDTEGRFLAVNQGFVQLYGQQNADQLVGKTDFDIASPELAESYRADDRAVLASGK